MLHVPSLLAILPMRIRTPRELDAFAMRLYLDSALAALAAIAVAAIIAYLLKFEGGSKPRDPGRRRTWFWVILAILVFVLFQYDTFYVNPLLALNLHARFYTVEVVSIVVAAVVYLLLGFLLSRLFPTGKLGNWLRLAR